MENFHDKKHFQRLIGWLKVGKELADWIDVISPVIDHKSCINDTTQSLKKFK